MAFGDLLKDRIVPVSQRMDELLNPRLKIENDLNRAINLGRSQIDTNSEFAPEQIQASDNIARAMSGFRQFMGAKMPVYRTEAERFDERMQGVDPTTPEGRIAAVQAAREISPGMGMELAQVFQAQEAERINQANLANRFGVVNETYDTGAIFNQSATGAMTFIEPPTIGPNGETIPGRTLTEPLAVTAARANHLRMEADNESGRALADQMAQQNAAAMQARITTAIDTTNGLQDKLRIYDQMETLIIETGATPGLPDRLMPNFLRSSANLEFEALGNELGLAVIAGANFGQLNESEMNLAMETDMPKYNKTEDYRNHFVKKKAATRKLMNEMVAYARFLRNNQADIARYTSENKGSSAQDFFTEERSRMRLANDAYSPTTNASDMLVARTLQELEALQNDDSIDGNTMIQFALPGKEVEYVKKGDR